MNSRYNSPVDTTPSDLSDKIGHDLLSDAK